MRISDWSSDVCSSDLSVSLEPSKASSGTPLTAAVPLTRCFDCLRKTSRMAAFDLRQHLRTTFFLARLCCGPLTSRCREASAGNASTTCFTKIGKHTSELQSLMRISYAVFCLKKKKQQLNTM